VMMPQALEKSAFCEIHLKRTENGKRLLKRIIEDYPNYSDIDRVRDTLIKVEK